MSYYKFDTLFSVARYPAGESHIQLMSHVNFGILRQNARHGIVIEAWTTSFEDICNVLTADAMLKRQGISSQWFIPYMPFARHDRRNHNGDGFELDIAIGMLKAINPVIADPHSDVSGSQLRYITQSAAVSLYRKYSLFSDSDYVIIPDQGAVKKTHSWLGKNLAIQGKKIRNPLTGALSGFGIDVDKLSDGSFNGANCIIVDDICDGGGTFLGLLKVLKDHGAGKVTLATTFGLYTKGVELLTDAFDSVVSFGDNLNGPSNLHQISFQDLYFYAENNEEIL